MKIRDKEGKFRELLLPPTGDTLPIGSVNAYAGDKLPTNWLLCNGQEVSRIEYADLFKAIGTIYGEGDGSTTFNLPDIKDRVVVGESNDMTLGSVGGEKEHKLTVDEMPSHTHAIGSEGAIKYGGFSSYFSENGLIHTWANADAHSQPEKIGGSKPHNNMQPYIVLKYIIKAKQSIGLVGNVTDMNGTNENDVPNVASVKEYVENYSTEEQAIGRWINGETIYRKVYKNVNVGTLNSSKYIDLLDLDNDIKGIIDIMATDTTQIFPTYESSLTFMKFKRNGTKLQIMGAGYNNWNIQITVKYTKTKEV